MSYQLYYIFTLIYNRYLFIYLLHSFITVISLLLILHQIFFFIKLIYSSNTLYITSYKPIVIPNNQLWTLCQSTLTKYSSILSILFSYCISIICSYSMSILSLFIWLANLILMLIHYLSYISSIFYLIFYLIFLYYLLLIF